MADRPGDERAPLLDHEAETEAGEQSSPPKEERTWTNIAWKVVLTVLGVFVLAVFIKGFIDAGDVDVSRIFLFHTLQGSSRWCARGQDTCMLVDGDVDGLFGSRRHSSHCEVLDLVRDMSFHMCILAYYCVSITSTPLERESLPWRYTLVPHCMTLIDRVSSR
ncbi:hypothetical protein C8Q80DRAFT_177200 [Daedaleopsis nitida]|nr:hypothetical protein C8Q80DRAFT_177200 [Daedaleopsis nitida]